MRRIIQVRIGNGYDVHKLVAGRPLILGGIKIPSDLGLEGHSDGDALTHAIMDALLGAAAMGDIGQHFPPGVDEFKGADSIELLKRVHAMLDEEDYEVVNIDSVIICEKPKLSPHYQAMRERLAEALKIDTDQVSVKATTAEKLGYLGRGEAIAAQAVVLIE